ncbi:MAG TPA: cytochrome c oxidase subunit II [Gaiellales bacterium]|nr:cytochrome c oxidase subunit II [Gaiellales bacterium]
MNTPRKDRLCAALLLAVVLPLSGCREQQNSLAPKSHQAKDIASLFWWMMGGAWLGLALVVGLLFWSWKRRNRRGLGDDVEGPKPGERRSWYVVLGLGIATPILVISALFVVSDLFVIKTTQAPAATATRMTVEVIGHQWWWEIRYPGTPAVTANELHIPVRTPVRIVATTADVIHSFWVPELNRKIDTIPGRRNSIELDANAPGVYRGACAEYCGLQHAHMALYVFAQPQADFRKWLANQSRPASASSGGEGARVFQDASCSSCHAIRGTNAKGDVGPDLTHVASRTTLAAVTIPNGDASLRDWITDNQHIKPGNQMPDIRLPGTQLDALAAYLEGLK